MSEIVKTLVEMGFDEQKSELAVKSTGACDIQDAMDWLLANSDVDVVEEAPASTSTETEEKEQNDEEKEQNDEEKEQSSDLAGAKSLKCDECGKLFQSHLEMEFHASKSGHASFSESTEEKKPLSEEEKFEQKMRLEKIMQQRRREREEKEKQDALDREKNRIRSGKEMIEAKRKQEEAEIKKLVEQRKREKQEEKLARQRVREQIEQDKIARKAKFSQPEAVIESPPKPSTASVQPVTSSKSYSEARLQIRLTNGSALTQTFGAKEPLSAVRLYVEMNRTDEPGPFSLMTSFPRKTFNVEDYDKPLDLLGLAPSAVIIVTKS